MSIKKMIALRDKLAVMSEDVELQSEVGTYFRFCPFEELATIRYKDMSITLNVEELEHLKKILNKLVD